MQSATLQTTYKIFVVCPPGIESILLNELKTIGIQGKQVKGGVEFNGDLVSLYSANLWLRSASRVLVRIGQFKLLSLKEAPERFSKYPWEIYLGYQTKIRVRAACHKSKIYHSDAISDRLAQGISKRLKRDIKIVKESQNPKAPLIFIRLSRNKCTISVDSSGEHLYKRGYKRFTVSAPLRENLAAAMLLASNYNGNKPLLDPFCGSGTILTEAAMIACRMPPGKRRKFAFMKWKNFDKSLWTKILQHSENFVKTPSAPIIGIDKDENAIIAATSNIQEADLYEFITIKKQDFLSFIPTNIPTGIIVTNPPYGKRTKENDSLLDFYSALGKHLRSKFVNWQINLILPKNYSNLKRSLGIPLKRITTFSNGGIKVDLLTGTL